MNVCCVCVCAFLISLCVLRLCVDKRYLCLRETHLEKIIDMGHRYKHIIHSRIF